MEGGTAPAISMRPSTTDWSSAGDVFVSAQRSSTRGGDRGGCLALRIASDTAERTVAAATASRRVHVGVVPDQQFEPRKPTLERGVS